MTLDLRDPTPGDAQAVSELVEAYDAEFIEDREVVSAQDVTDWWESEDEVKLAYIGGELAAQVSLSKREDRLHADAFVHPRFWGRGLSMRLVEWVEERARQQGLTAVRLSAHGTDERGACLLRSRGYERIRSFFRMLIDLDAEPPPVTFPDGYTLETLQPGDERLLYETASDAFRDHWGHVPRTFDEWMKGRRIEHDLCFLLRHDGELVAEAECRSDFLGMGWISTLGTKRAHRKRGLGEALLRHAFREIYARGVTRIGLGVDAESLTGATRLYERAGMRVAWRADVYEKRR